MKCPIPNCRKPALVLDSRQSDDTERRRRYRCTQGHRFTTSERVVGKVASGADGVTVVLPVEDDTHTPYPMNVCLRNAEELTAFVRKYASGVDVPRGPAVLNALQVLERMDYKPGDRVLVENFLRIMGERGMWVIENPLTSGVLEVDRG